MSATKDPIEVTVEKNGNVIILIDQHNMSAAVMLDMAARAMLGAGYDKPQVVQAALAYARKHDASEGTAEAPKSGTAAESREALVQEPAESKDEPPLSALDKEPATPEIEEVTASSSETTPEEMPPMTDMAVEETVTPPVPDPTPVMEIAAATETPTPSEPLSPAMMDEVLAADRKRLQALFGSSNGTNSNGEPVAANPVNPGIPAWSVPAWPTPLRSESESSPIPLDENANLQETETDQVTEMATAQDEWLNQKFDPNTSSSMLIPPMPETLEVAANELATPPVEPEAAPPSTKPPVTLLSRLTGFVKLETMAIPRYPSQAEKSTISTPKPVAPPVLAPPLRAPTNR